MTESIWAAARGVMRIIHTADWQIGKVFKQFGAKEETLRQARLAAIERLGALARTHGAHHVLVAGDVYENEAPNTITLRAPIERMKPFADVHWHLLPGNHDPHRPEGVWDRVAQLGLPPNIHLHLAPTPFALGDDAFLLPAPLLRKSELDYLALGDWHRTLQVGPAIWYAGTPEPDRAGGQEQGTALLVDIAGPGAA